MLGGAGCLDAQVDDGVLRCSEVPGRACPRNYYCAGNGYCYRDGHGPGTAPRDLATSPRDLAITLPIVEDLATPEQPPTD